MIYSITISVGFLFKMHKMSSYKKQKIMLPFLT